MKSAIFFVAAISLASLWQQMTRPTSSHAATERGKSAFAHQRFDDAAKEYEDASRMAPSPRAAFNRGTAEIAAGRREQGSAALDEAMKDRTLVPGSLYNRGNAALASKAYEHAIRDYEATLRLRPDDEAAKRNLEIALRRLQQQQQQQQQRGGGGEQPQPQQPDPQQPQPAPGQQQKGEADAEALLRSVQQQEQEELARMKKARGDSRRVGW